MIDSGARSSGLETLRRGGTGVRGARRNVTRTSPSFGTPLAGAGSNQPSIRTGQPSSPGGFFGRWFFGRKASSRWSLEHHLDALARPELRTGFRELSDDT